MKISVLPVLVLAGFISSLNAMEESAQTMQVNIKTTNGLHFFGSKKSVDFSVSIIKNATVGELKVAIECEKGFPVEKQHILYLGRKLNNNFPLKSLNLHPHSTLWLIVSQGSNRL